MRLSLRSLLALPLLVVLALPACAATSPGDGDEGETSSALSTSSCGLTRSKILASVSGGRRTAIQRGFTWLDADVPYSQSASHGGYRTDCSGFVSMCWQLGSSYTTADFASGGGDASPLGSYATLLPGDALVRRAGGSGHIVLFLGWSDAAKTSACVLEEASTASDMQFRARSKASLVSSGFKAIRADKLDASSATPTGEDDPASDADPAPGTPSTPPAPGNDGSGARCTSTGQCNPGNDGAGLVCVSGRCVPGCLTVAQCPGITSCEGGQCR